MRIQKREQNENILPNTDEEKRILNAYNYFERKLSRKNILQEIKKRYPDSTIISVVSSSFTQRGDISLLNKWDKTKIALDNGIDLVIEAVIF